MNEQNIAKALVILQRFWIIFLVITTSTTVLANVSITAIVSMNSSPSIPTLIAEPNQQDISSVDLQWQASTDDENDSIKYFIRVATTSSGTNVLDANTSTTDYNNLSVSIGSTYYWSVKACDNNNGDWNHCSSWSSEGSFTITTASSGITTGPASTEEEEEETEEEEKEETEEKEEAAETEGKEEETEEEKDEEAEKPVQLLDISHSLAESIISSSDGLSALITFESFGTEPTTVSLTFIILDSAGNEVHREEDSITVITEEILRKTFKGQGLPDGKYTFVLQTLYNVDVFDEFRQEFEIKKPLLATPLERTLLLGGTAIIVTLLITITIIKRKKID